MNRPGSVEYTTNEQVAVITLNRPTVKNALTWTMLADLKRAIADFNHDDSLRVAILTGSGDEAFCSGADLDETIPLLTDGGLSAIIEEPTKRFFSDVYKPIISAVNGYCIAGGLEILLGTDIRIAADHAMFGLSEVRWGIVPAAGSHIRLPQQIPISIAMELLLTGQPITAQRAAAIGLVNKVVPRDSLMHEAHSIAATLCRNGPLAIRTAKEIAVRSEKQETGFVLERYMSECVFTSHDAIEGPRAFVERRTPIFFGR
ncbi:enoyl-CoA hydratase/isomerase family protein [Rhodococcus ruber]|uniref:enoyl-CoA hydratase/isomerase family protein n=1 Tax=Rhodococcus ruber TaxID=1830 RepID=UPI00315D4976